MTPRVLYKVPQKSYFDMYETIFILSPSSDEFSTALLTCCCQIPAFTVCVVESVANMNIDSFYFFYIKKKNAVCIESVTTYKKHHVLKKIKWTNECEILYG